MVSIPAAAGKIHIATRLDDKNYPVSIPAAAGKIHHRQWLGQIRQDQGFQFPQLRVRYILQSPQGLRMLFVSIPAVAGKIHLYAGVYLLPIFRFNSRSCG